jgi:nickel-dependent lactate racemase
MARHDLPQGGHVLSIDIPKAYLGEMVTPFRTEPVASPVACVRRVYMGTSSRGIPAWIHRDVARADIRIGIGMIMPHLDAGYGGGAKIVLPGVCSQTTVEAFHCQMAAIATNQLGIENAALRLDLERFVNECVGLDFILNVILDRRGNLYRCVAGDAVAAHRAGIRFARRVYGVPVKERYPLVIANAYPHQVDLWQCTNRETGPNRLSISTA